MFGSWEKGASHKHRTNTNTFFDRKYFLWVIIKYYELLIFWYLRNYLLFNGQSYIIFASRKASNQFIGTLKVYINFIESLFLCPRRIPLNASPTGIPPTTDDSWEAWTRYIGKIRKLPTHQPTHPHCALLNNMNRTWTFF